MNGLVWSDPCYGSDYDRYWQSPELQAELRPLALQAEYVRNERYPYQKLVAIASAAEFRRFISAWEANDPNGTWFADGVTECMGTRDSSLLVYIDNEGTVQTFAREDADESGNALYAIDGFNWSTTEGQDK
jgi:hypothetical protein